ncbi:MULTISPECIES: ABC transporter ATP-binding protein [Brevibacillus]|jgi:ABC-type multidrug transport system, ATPase component|uniref:Antibiotic ABC transporter ATP-binding protein n=1 Tax=Brevibacillus parabrevis TaxID=54914 RepID=A0A4Y3PLH5_BREPA|nr:MULTISPECIES: ABC transporter ATP-binding protein [Brevibacillus]MBU8715199.1 ABC transporter ATP-binding protein [Brevibacillus parabrevis]MDH6352773.1 ABC-2 type transport system ATP-binding protein [Brevibacillus sp. 1238]MDR4999865.1 ABC transporter ATP-binding protein [Brevibacillus parabrevis]MED1725681.1 ABC transporter ATP-binding protein [Brevibacillus parabrevis]MED2255035.1 ABC transporter ATP-binding protein [Brevibacillus parabrevis]
MSHVLEIRNLTKKFGDFIAVDNMTLNIGEGEIFGFLGANGAGKSTTINMIASLLRPTKGEIVLLGKNIVKDSKFAKMNTGIVPQELAIYEDMTAYENVSFFAGLYGLRGAMLRERTEEALAFVGLGDKHQSFPKNFSGGMKRRLNIACAIAHLPKLIIMDEPTVGIDPQSRNYILQSVRKLNEMGCTIIYTSHYMEEVEEICTRIAIVDHGKIIAEGTKEQLTSIITDTKEIWIGFRADGAISIESLQGIAGVTAVRQEENTLKIVSKSEVNNLNRIIQQLIKDQVEIRSVEEQAPNLESVFLTLTGRNLRD